MACCAALRSPCRACSTSVVHRVFRRRTNQPAPHHRLPKEGPRGETTTLAQCPHFPGVARARQLRCQARACRAYGRLVRAHSAELKRTFHQLDRSPGRRPHYTRDRAASHPQGLRRARATSGRTQPHGAVPRLPFRQDAPRRVAVNMTSGRPAVLACDPRQVCFSPVIRGSRTSCARSSLSELAGSSSAPAGSGPWATWSPSRRKPLRSGPASAPQFQRGRRPRDVRL